MDETERAFFEKQSEKHGETLEGIHGRLNEVVESVAEHSTRIAVIETKHKALGTTVKELKDLPDKNLGRLKTVVYITSTLLGLLIIGAGCIAANAWMGA